MIGKVYISVVDFYDVKISATRRKKRPVLVVGGPNENDYTVLPISTITNQANRNSYYDIPVSASDRATLCLDRACFIRSHKQMPIHRGSLLKEIGDMMADTPALYLEAVAKMEEFQKKVVTYSI